MYNAVTDATTLARVRLKPHSARVVPERSEWEGVPVSRRRSQRKPFEPGVLPGTVRQDRWGVFAVQISFLPFQNGDKAPLSDKPLEEQERI